MIKKYNESHGNKIIHNDAETTNELWMKLRTAMGTECDDICMINKLNIKTDRDVVKFLKPFRPPEWDKNPNEWLSSLDIIAVMEQYEKRFKDFKFIGPTPIDFNEKIGGFGKCVYDELCKINVEKLYNNDIRKIGIIFNLDKHTQSGSHWVAMYVNLIQPVYIGYWDSVAEKPPSEINELINILNKQIKDVNDQEPEIKINTVQHQFKNTECGMYCLYFIIEQLRGRTFEDIIYKKISDNQMDDYRYGYFIDSRNNTDTKK